VYCAAGHFCILVHYKCPSIIIIVIIIIIIIIDSPNRADSHRSGLMMFKFTQLLFLADSDIVYSNY